MSDERRPTRKDVEERFHWNNVDPHHMAANLRPFADQLNMIGILLWDIREALHRISPPPKGHDCGFDTGAWLPGDDDA